MADDKSLGGGWDKRDLPEWMKEEDVPEWMKEGEKPFEVGGKEIKPIPFRQTYNIDQYMIDMLGEEPFFAGMMMQMQKVMTMSIPTMAVTFARDQFTLLINPIFVQELHDKHRKADIHSVLMHENMHPLSDHFTTRWKDGRHKKAWGWATDSAINSTLTKKMGRTLPGSPIVPGLRPGVPFDLKADPIEPERQVEFKKWLNSPPTPLERAVMNAPQGQAAEFYYDLYLPHMEEEDKNGESSGFGEPGTDDHEVWGDPQTAGESPEYLKERTKELVKNAAEHADKKHNWGTVPADMQAEIREMFASKIDWKDELSEWVGMQYVNLDKFNSMRRVHRKYPYQQPGKRRGRGLHVVIGSDQSASVDDQLLALLCAQVRSLGDVSKITFVPFDVTVDTQHVMEWEAGDHPTFKRTRSGGTDFSRVTEWVNSDENRGRFDLFMITTDGGAPRPVDSRIPRLWLLAKGDKLAFQTNEKCIYVPLDG